MTVDSKLDAVRHNVGPLKGDSSDKAGLLLGRLTVLPALVLLPFLLTSFPLLLVGYFKPVPVIVLWLALTALVVPYVWRRVPSVTGAPDWGTAGAGRAKPTPRWVLWSLAVIAVAFGVFQGIYHSEFVIVQLDAASYMEFATWISKHGSLPIPQDTAAFGHASGITFWSAAFYNVGSSIVPQFMAGLPMVLSLGFWAGGARLALLWGPLLGALGVFTFGGLVARLVGPRWAPFAALAMAIGIPEAYASRNTYSETLAQILLLGALSLWIDSQRTDRGQEDAGRWRAHWRSHARSASHVLAAVTGLVFGITLLVRIDGPADILFVVPYCGLLVLRRQRQVIPLVAGMLVGLLYGTVDSLFLTLPYLKTNLKSVELMVAAFVLFTVATVLVVRWLRKRGSQLRTPAGPRLVRAVTALPFIVVAAFLIRPYVERNWHALQYAPLSLHWIYWYTGFSTITFAVIATAMLGRRAVKGEAPVWVLPLLTFAWAIMWFLLRPAITPHQPYASRRLVPAVLPGLILLAVWLSAWLARRSRVVRMVNVPRYLERSPASLRDRLLRRRDLPAAVYRQLRPRAQVRRPDRRHALLGGPRVPARLRRRGRRGRADLPGHPGQRVGAHRELHAEPAVRAGHQGHVQRADRRRGMGEPWREQSPGHRHRHGHRACRRAGHRAGRAAPHRPHNQRPVVVQARQGHRAAGDDPEYQHRRARNLWYAEGHAA